MNSRLVETREMKRHFSPDLFCFLPAAAPGSPPDSASHSQQDQVVQKAEMEKIFTNLDRILL